MKKFYALSLAILFSVSVFATGHTVTITTTSPITCFGACNGSLTANVAGGVGPFTYSWAPSGGTGASATALCAGNYTVTVTDNNDMSTTIATATLSDPPLLNVSVSGAMVCTGSCAPLNAIVTGGTGMCTYNWTPAASLSASTIPSPTACPATTTTYTVTVADMNGCTDWTSVTVTVIPPPTIVVPPTYDVCAGACVAMSASGATTYSWNGPMAYSASTCCPTICPAVAGTYTVTGVSMGCAATATTTVTVGGVITSNITSTNTTSCGSCDGYISIAPMGGSTPYMYDWGSGGTTVATAGPLCAGTYSVTITDAMGCSIVDSENIFDGTTATANYTPVPDSTDAYNFFFFNSSTGTGNTYLWDFADGANSAAASPSHTYAIAGTYTVCLFVFNSVCGNDTLCQTLNVTGVLSSCEALFNIADDTLNTDPNAHYVYNLSYGATLSYLWDFGDGTTSTSATPSHVYASTGPYLLCLTVDNGSGCTDTYCDSLISADSLNHSSGQLELVVYDVPPFQDLTTGVEETNINVVSVYPNPFSENTVFNLNRKGNTTYDFVLFDALGRNVRTMNGLSGNTFTVSREDLSKGIYFYKVVTTEEEIGAGKLIIK